MSGTFNLDKVVADTVEFNTLGKTILPANSNVSLGASYAPFKELYISGNTINLGGVSLKGSSNENGMVFAPEGAIELDPGASGEKITIDPSGEGIKFGTDMSIGKTHMTVGQGSNAVQIGSNIFDQMTDIAGEQARVTFDATSTAGDFGFLLDYELSFNPDNNMITTIGGANFEVGKKMNKKDSMGLNTFVIKDVDNPLFELHANGVSRIVTEGEKNSKKNEKIEGNKIKVALGSDDKHLIPIEQHVNFRDMFPFNVLDVHRREGAAKFKADFDNVGQFLYSEDGTTFSGMNALNQYVQLSHPDLHAQHGSTFGVQPLTIKLNEYESVVEFISYYHLPLLFENQSETNTDFKSFEYYSSSLISNRLDNKVYKSSGAAPISEIVNGTSVIMYGVNLNTYFTKTADGLVHKKFYPTIRVIKYKNTYDAVFSKVGTDDYAGDFLTALGWGSPAVSNATVLAKYTTGTKMGENWMRKLTEITYAYLKHGKPLKLLNTADSLEVVEVYNKVLSDPNRYLEINEASTELSVEIRKAAFQGYLYQ